MATPVHRDQVRDLVARGAQLVEVLPRKEYDEFHLAGAVNIPLKHLAERAGELDKTRPVVTYCWDSRCDLSARAAHRLEALGFAEVYDYVASKVDWTANGLPIEGDEVRVTHIGDLADRDVPTCRLGEQPERDCVVVDAANVVLGLVRGGRIHEGPSTYRPDVTVEEMADRLKEHPEPRVLVTNADGTLVGIAAAEDIERATRTAR